MSNIRFSFSFYLLLISFRLFSQEIELGGALGVLNYTGDLSPYPHPLFFRPGGEIMVLYNFNNIHSVKANVLSGYITAFDDQFNEPFRVRRNLHFRSLIIESGVQYQYNFLEFKNGKNTWSFSPFLFVGLAYFHHNPTAEYNGKWVELQELKTEGQEQPGNLKRPYSLSGTCIPFGIGFKYSVSTRINLNIEMGARKTFTDYLDDVSGFYYNNSGLGDPARYLADRSNELPEYENFTNPDGSQRGNPKKDDWYYFLSVGLSYIFYWPKCPTFML